MDETEKLNLPPGRYLCRLIACRAGGFTQKDDHFTYVIADGPYQGYHIHIYKPARFYNLRVAYDNDQTKEEPIFDVSIIVDRENWLSARNELREILKANPKITYKTTKKVLECFINNPLVTVEIIERDVWGKGKGPKLLVANVNQHIVFLRKEFERFGIYFKNLGNGVGWTLEKGRGHYD